MVILLGHRDQRRSAIQHLSAAASGMRGPEHESRKIELRVNGIEESSKRL
ncbi:hypothetical protein [Sorangium cellulosum]